MYKGWIESEMHCSEAQKQRLSKRYKAGSHCISCDRLWNLNGLTRSMFISRAHKAQCGCFIPLALFHSGRQLPFKHWHWDRSSLGLHHFLGLVSFVPMHSSSWWTGKECGWFLRVILGARSRRGVHHFYSNHNGQNISSASNWPLTFSCMLRIRINRFYTNV